MPTLRAIACGLGLLLAGSLLLGCGAARFDGQIFEGDGFAFRIPEPPRRWQRLAGSDDALAFRDDAHGATIMLHGRCGLDGDDVPLSALFNHLFLQFTERQIQQQQTVPFDEREALHTVLTAKLDGVPMAFDSWVLKKDGCVYDLLYLAPPEAFERGLPRFRELVGGFATLDAHDR